MSDDHIEQSLQKYFIDELGLPDTLSFDDLLIEKGFLASAQLIDIVTFIEDELGVLLKPVDVQPENLTSIRAMAEVVRKRGGA